MKSHAIRPGSVCNTQRLRGCSDWHCTGSTDTRSVISRTTRHGLPVSEHPLRDVPRHRSRYSTSIFSRLLFIECFSNQLRYVAKLTLFETRRGYTLNALALTNGVLNLNLSRLFAF